MEDSTLYNPTNCIGSYFPTTLLGSLALSPCIDGHYSGLQPDDDGSSPDYPYFKPFMVLDLIWNLGFVLVSVFVLLCSVGEKPSTPLRVWILGYALQCLLHVGFVYYEHQRLFNGGAHGGVMMFEGHSHRSIVKKLESANTIASSFWWVVGFYWIVAGGPSLLQDSPSLYWLTVVFLALDVFFMIFWIGVACVICLALFCCIPIVAIAYAMTIREGASEDEIRQLPTYRFHNPYAPRMSASVEFGSMPAINELSFQPEDAECCICLTAYSDGAQLCTLPCNHHFHYGCISRWLRINASCPLCKFNIKDKGDTLV